tara:strand:- start:11449 stop:12681 length:1233 start_codon:yes stop_codon:yes gene_type:complete
MLRPFDYEYFPYKNESIDDIVNFIKNEEGFLSSPRKDGNVFRGGFGSDTTTLADGTVVSVTPDMKITEADADRDIERRLLTEFLPAVEGAVGSEAYSNLSSGARAALASIAYNYGAGFAKKGYMADVISAARDNDESRLASAVSNLGNLTSGIHNPNRRNREADIIRSGLVNVRPWDMQDSSRTIPFQGGNQAGNNVTNLLDIFKDFGSNFGQNLREFTGADAYEGMSDKERFRRNLELAAGRIGSDDMNRADEINRLLSGGGSKLLQAMSFGLLNPAADMKRRATKMLELLDSGAEIIRMGDEGGVLGIMDPETNRFLTFGGTEGRDSDMNVVRDIGGDDDRPVEVLERNYTIGSDGVVVCNDEGYVYDSGKKMCVPVTEDPDLGMATGGSVGLNKVADNFLRALGGMQ